MEPTQPIVTHIRCLLHEQDIVRRVGISNTADISLLCGECVESMEGKQNQTRYTLENFMKYVTQNTSPLPKLQQLPESTTQILNTEKEIGTEFNQHIEKQKEQVITIIGKLKESVIQKLEYKKRELIANLDAQVKAFTEVLALYKQKVYSFKEDNPQHQQEPPLTFDSLYKEVSKIANAKDLKKLLHMHYENMKNNEIFTVMKDDDAKKIIADSIEAMDSKLMKSLSSKPVISFGLNNASFEEVCKIWDGQIDTALNGLKIDIKDPVKLIQFQLVGTGLFDSMILGNDLENKKMVANWVYEAIKSKAGLFSLLYRGSRDGFEAKDFHEKCDNKGPTLVIIENTNGNKFGGYASVSWTGPPNPATVMSEESMSSFLFSVDKKEKLLYRPESKLWVLYHSAAVGPIFGWGPALRVGDKCNVNSENWCDPTHNSFQSLIEGGYISGTKYFKVKEIEVYSVAPV